MSLIRHFSSWQITIYRSEWNLVIFYNPGMLSINYKKMFYLNACCPIGTQKGSQFGNNSFLISYQLGVGTMLKNFSKTSSVWRKVSSPERHTAWTKEVIWWQMRKVCQGYGGITFLRYCEVTWMPPLEKTANRHQSTTTGQRYRRPGITRPHTTTQKQQGWRARRPPCWFV